MYFSTRSPSERTLKMARIAAESGYRVAVVEWDRSGSRLRVEKEGSIEFTRLPLKSPYGAAAILVLPLWLAYVSVILLRTRFHLVQPKNLDNLLPALLIRRLRGFKVVYDMADFYSDTYASGAPLLRSLARFLERSLTKASDAVVLAEPGQMRQVGASRPPTNWMTFYNVPFSANPISPGENGSAVKGGVLSLLYIGTFPRDRTRALLNLMEAMRALPIQLTIAGFGQDLNAIAQFASSLPNVVFLGKVPSGEIMPLTEKSDIVVLPYDSRFRNYAGVLGTKIFEAMAAAKPILAQKGTASGNLVSEYLLGYLTDFSKTNILRETLEQIMQASRADLELMGRRGRALMDLNFNPKTIAERYRAVLDRATVSP